MKMNVRKRKKEKNVQLKNNTKTYMNLQKLSFGHQPTQSEELHNVEYFLSFFQNFQKFVQS